MDHFGVCFQVIILMTSSELLGARGPELPGDEKNVITMSDEKRLIKKLLDDYETVGVVGRPVYNTSQTISVSYGLSLIQILDLDEKNQVLTTNVWSKYGWNDVMLKWKPEDFGELTKVRVPVTKIWKPDIVLYNFADERLKEHREAMAVVQNNGEVLWLPAAIFKSTCSIDIVYFPFDIQKCHLKFGSWTYDGFELDLNLPEDANGLIDLTDYLESNEWKILGHPGRKNKKFYTCCVQPYYDLTFSIIMKRIPFAHIFSLIIPCFLLSVLTLVSFWLPPESPAKILLGMNLFLAFFLLLKILSVSTPASKSIPLIGAYFCLNMVLITLSSFISVAVINLYKRDDKRNKVPKWLKKIVIEGLSRILCMEQRKNIVKKPRRNHVTHHVTHVIDGTTDGRKSHHEKTIKSPVLPYNKWEPPSPVNCNTQQVVGRPDSPIVNHPLPSLCIMSSSNTDEQIQPPIIPIHPPPIFTSYQNSIETEVKEVKKVLRNFMSRLQVRDAKEKNAMEWRLVSLVIDRVFFILYVITVIVSTVTVYIMCFMYYESTEHIEVPDAKDESH